MNITLLLLADRGGVKAFRVANNSLQLVGFYRIEEARKKKEDKLTDKAGAFPAGGAGSHASPSGERMTAEAEEEMRSFRKVATTLMEILDEEKPGRWAFAAPSEINGAILDGIPATYREGLVQNLRADLLNIPQQDLLSHFQAHPSGT